MPERRSLSRWAAAALVLAVGAGAGAAVAEGDHDRVRRMMRQGQIVPLEQVIEAARAEHAGKILEAKLEHEYGRWVYELEILGEDGVVWELYFDARTGELFERHPEH